GLLDLEPIGENERSEEAAGGNAAVQVGGFSCALVGAIALARDRKLAALEGDRQIIGREPGNRQGDANRRFAALLDVIGRIRLRRRTGSPVDQSTGVVKSEQEGAVEQNCACAHAALLEAA